MQLSSILGQQIASLQPFGGINRARTVQGDGTAVGSGLLSADKVSLSPHAMQLHEASRVHSFSPTFTAQGAKVSLVEGAAENGKTFTMLIQRAGKEDQVVSFSGDVRLSFDAEGNAVVKEGADALDNGVLKAQADGDVLIRTGASEVDSGKFSTTVVSLTSSAATYKGGAGETSYVGNFAKSTIEGGNGNNTFYGVFSASTIVGGSGVNNFIGDFSASLLQGGKGDNSFKGTYTNAQIAGGNGTNTYEGRYAQTAIEGGAGVDNFLGDFISNSVLKGNAGNDVYTGNFAGSVLDGGAGDDLFGKEISLALNEDKSKYIINASLVDSTIIGGDGNDTVQGVHGNNNIDLGEGDNIATGMFIGSTIQSGNGNDSVKAYYLKDSTVNTGAGTNNLHIATSINSQIIGSSTSDSVTMGVAAGDESWEASLSSGGSVNMANMTIGDATQGDSTENAVAFGSIITTTKEEEKTEPATQPQALLDALVTTVESFANTANVSHQQYGFAASAKGYAQYSQAQQYNGLQPDAQQRLQHIYA